MSKVRQSSRMRGRVHTIKIAYAGKENTVSGWWVSPSPAEKEKRKSQASFEF